MSDLNKTRSTPAAQALLSASALTANPLLLGLPSGSTLDLAQRAVGEGVELLWATAWLAAPLELNLRDDRDFIQFNYGLEGRAECRVRLPRGRRQEFVHQQEGCIQFTPDLLGNFRMQGRFRSVSVAVQPAVLQSWLDGEADMELARSLAAGDYLSLGHRSAALHVAATELYRHLTPDTPAHAQPQQRHPLWLQGQILRFVGLILESRRPSLAGSPLCPSDIARLTRARDQLLADLSCAPTLAALAATQGLSLLKLKKGFRLLFGHSPYALFQIERMHAAQHMLRRGERSVTSVASELGYTNISHFAAAFRKQLGVNPAQIARAR
ncbi:AraC family transcriptional regulator [Paucibacter oligotrophus]|uniref:AraC family transcriptional regulator n=1 Tax=Roseateles oligotrophus TaxID=1769250 RepID=A0A840LIH3_9BURK|nr:AraC family transcriptional regulator [Roseateles oligotrophus]MBB4846008.1 AraC family transcriptional regulator [Roseateles oligotrophus]